MKVAVVNNAVPFVRGGAEFLADWLVERLRLFGHDALLVRVPFRWDPPERILDSMLACRMMRIPNCDRVVALKFPVYLIPHESRVVWLMHQFRQAYDLWGTPLQFLPSSEDGLRVRELIRRADTDVLASTRRIYTNSRVTSERLHHFNNIPSEVLYPPLQNPEAFRSEEYGDYIFCPSRMNDAKRQHLLVESMRHTRTQARLVLAGRAEDPQYLARMEETVERNGLGRKVSLLARFISDDEKIQLFSRSLACAYVPFDEDSYGYVTMESFEACRPVIACTDSGGLDLLVRDFETGRLVPPQPEAIAAAIDELYENRARAQSMGEAGRALVQAMGITWENVIQKLTAP